MSRRTPGASLAKLHCAFETHFTVFGADRERPAWRDVDIPTLDSRGQTPPRAPPPRTRARGVRCCKSCPPGYTLLSGVSLRPTPRRDPARRPLALGPILDPCLDRGGAGCLAHRAPDAPSCGRHPSCRQDDRSRMAAGRKRGGAGCGAGPRHFGPLGHHCGSPRGRDGAGPTSPFETSGRSCRGCGTWTPHSPGPSRVRYCIAKCPTNA